MRRHAPEDLPRACPEFGESSGSQRTEVACIDLLLQGALIALVELPSNGRVPHVNNIPTGINAPAG